ncbi:MAG: hypothetical protein P9L99_15955 [Candidatus Lernaella stagnicola]|nr:hypothetical protein [Candidatus Lernaella stagnicola]
MKPSMWIVCCAMASALFLILPACSDNETETECDDCPPVDDDDNNDDDDDATPAPIIGPPTRVVPSSGLPPDLALQDANNNLDVTRHDDRVFLAFRTAPSHFAAETAEIHVVSSLDQVHWDHEMSFHLGRDLREPRLLSWDGGLFLYFAFLGTNPINFEPGGMMVAEYLGPGDWTEPAEFYGQGFIPWRTKTIDGVPYMLTYVGGESVYSIDPEPIDVHFLTTADGYTWVPVVPGQPVVIEGGCTETDVVFLDNGDLVAVSRCEARDTLGFGMRICRAPAEDLGRWECVMDPKKYDSPLLFREGDDIYLIGRRNLTADGNYNLGYDTLPDLLQYLIYELDYWIAPKRTSLWRVNPETLTVSFVDDFPSRGDTSFAGIIGEGEHAYEVYNYTSPLQEPDYVWLMGQLGKTVIVRVTLTFPQ